MRRGPTRIFSVLFVIVGTLCFCELLTRILFPATCSIVQPHPIYNHAARSNSTCSLDADATRKVSARTFRFNSVGWRENVEFALEKGPDVYRVMVLGDSFTMGTCAEELSMPRIVERVVSSKVLSKGKKIEVINTGFISYSPAIYSILADKLFSYKPNLILLSIDMTDVFDDFTYDQDRTLDEQGRVVSFPAGGQFSRGHIRVNGGLRRSSFFERTLRFFSFSRFMTIVNENFQHYSGRNLTEDMDLPRVFDWCDTPWSNFTGERVKRTENYIREFLRRAKSEGTTTVITAIPHLPQLRGEGKFSDTAPFETIQRLAGEEGALYFDSYIALKVEADRLGAETLFVQKDMHFNDTGYELWGKAMASFILSAINAETILIKGSGSASP